MNSRVPRVLGVDDFALRRGQVYATVLIDAETGQRVDVLPGRRAEVLETWLREMSTKYELTSRMRMPMERKDHRDRIYVIDSYVEVFRFIPIQ